MAQYIQDNPIIIQCEEEQALTLDLLALSDDPITAIWIDPIWKDIMFTSAKFKVYRINFEGTVLLQANYLTAL